MGPNAIVKAPVTAVWAVRRIIGYGWQRPLATGIAAAGVVAMPAPTVAFSVPRFTKVRGLDDAINRPVRERLQGIRPVRAHNAEQHGQDRFRAADDDIADNSFTARRVMAVTSPGTTFVTSALTLAAYWTGAYLVEAAGMSDKLGAYSGTAVFPNYATQVVIAFAPLSMVFVLLPRAQVAARRVGYIPQTATLFKGTVTSNITYGDLRPRGHRARRRRSTSCSASTSLTAAPPSSTACARATSRARTRTTSSPWRCRTRGSSRGRCARTSRSTPRASPTRCSTRPAGSPTT